MFFRIYIKRNDMKTEKIYTILVFLILLFFLPEATFTHEPIDEFYNLKLEVVEVRTVGKKNRKRTSYTINDSFLFFSTRGIYATDKRGILLYEFVDHPLLEQNFDSTDVLTDRRVTITAVDTSVRDTCIIVVKYHIGTDMREVYISYHDYLFALKTKEFK